MTWIGGDGLMDTYNVLVFKLHVFQCFTTHRWVLYLFGMPMFVPVMGENPFSYRIAPLPGT